MSCFKRLVMLGLWPFILSKKIKFTYSQLESCVYFMNKIWDLTNSNDMHFFSDIEKENFPC